MRLFLSGMLGVSLIAMAAVAGEIKEKSEGFEVTVEAVADQKPIPAKFALCKPTKDGKSTDALNARPNMYWKNPPEGTKSYAIIVHDTDVPRDFSKAGKEGIEIAKDAHRQNFYHWGLADIPADIKAIERNYFSEAITFGTPLVNDLGKYMPDPKQYGGPCPPWNDARVHTYHFTVYALDTDSLKLAKDATAKQVAAMLSQNKHVLAKAEAVGTYTLNPALKPKKAATGGH